MVVKLYTVSMKTRSDQAQHFRVDDALLVVELLTAEARTGLSIGDKVISFQDEDVNSKGQLDDLILNEIGSWRIRVMRSVVTERTVLQSAEYAAKIVGLGHIDDDVVGFLMEELSPTSAYSKHGRDVLVFFDSSAARDALLTKRKILLNDALYSITASPVPSPSPFSYVMFTFKSENQVEHVVRSVKMLGRLVSVVSLTRKGEPKWRLLVQFQKEITSALAIQFGVQVGGVTVLGKSYTPTTGQEPSLSEEEEDL